jgi:transposase
VPPSADGLAKPPPRSRSLRKKTGRKPGGQDGHPGQTLAQVAKADREERHEPACCGRCGAGLAGRPVTAVERRQVSGLPPVTVTVTEHQLIERQCGCGYRTRGAAPQGAGRGCLRRFCALVAARGVYFLYTAARAQQHYPHVPVAEKSS